MMRIVVADEISPDSCRLWDIKSNDKLDKDRFRRDMGGARRGLYRGGAPPRHHAGERAAAHRAGAASSSSNAQGVGSIRTRFRS
jgi:phosphoribosylaminoimidazole-succinocarboxamide synthase